MANEEKNEKTNGKTNDIKNEKTHEKTISEVTAKKKTIKKKTIKKKKKLLLQIMCVTLPYSLLLALAFSGLMYMVGIYTYVVAKQEQLQENLDHLYQHLFEDDEIGLFISGKLTNYIDEEVDDLNSIADVFNYGGNLDLNEYYEMFFAMQDAGKTPQEIGDAIPDKWMHYAACDVYTSLLISLFDEQERFQYKQILLVSARDGRLLFNASASDHDMVNHYLMEEGWYAGYMKEHHIGEIWEEWEDYRNNEDVQKMLKTGTSEIAYITDREDGQESLAGGYPVMVDGQVRWLLVIKYDWSVFQDKMLDQTSKLSRVSVIFIIVSEALLLLYVYFSAVRPLRKIKKSLNKYIQSKDSDAVVSEMSKIRQKNEFGLLADDIAAMVREIDRYTSENMELAGEQEKSAIELELAAKIQNGMLLHDFPVTPEYEIYAMMDPAKEVGGDFYDFFEVDATHLALVIADVAGKGVPGSLFMMSALSIIRNKTVVGVKPSEILAQVNNELLKGDFGDMFVTVWLGILDLETGCVTAANAGHEYPILKTGDRFELLKDKHGFVVGGMEGVKYTDYEIDLHDGGTLFVYTDGVPEATAASDELYGTDRILEALNLYPDATPAELAKNVKLDVDLFVGEAEQFDDLTILCIRYRKSALRKE